MKSSIKWTLAILLLISITAIFWVGPGRLYGISRSKQIVGTIEKIQPRGSGASEVPTEFIVELSASDGEIFTFVSADAQWGVMSKGDHVRASLYPAAPWSGESGSWRDARLIAKLAKLPGEEGDTKVATAKATPAPPAAKAVAVVPPTRAPGKIAPARSTPAPTTHPVADNKPTAQGSMLMTFGATGVPIVFFGLRRKRRRSSFHTADSEK